MDFTRRQFIQVTGATAAGLAVSGMGFDLKPIKAHAQMLKTEYAKQTTSICPYCAVGCGVIVYTSQKGDGRVIDIEGDPDWPSSPKTNSASPIPCTEPPIPKSGKRSPGTGR